LNAPGNFAAIPIKFAALNAGVVVAEAAGVDEAIFFDFGYIFG
jgi:hypothetical protein